MKRFFIWLQKNEGWKSLLALVYALICVFDFIVIPAWIGATRVQLDTSVFAQSDVDHDIQMQLIELAWAPYEPLTLKGAGMFHLAFGALLTGSALARRKEEDNYNE
jgi:hypothetical protein